MRLAPHILKTWPQHFEAVKSGQKTFEVRRNDRDFRPGDMVILIEWNPEYKAHTGRQHLATIGYVLKSSDMPAEYGFTLPEDTVIFSLCPRRPTMQDRMADLRRQRNGPVYVLLTIAMIALLVYAIASYSALIDVMAATMIGSPIPLMAITIATISLAVALLAAR